MASNLTTRIFAALVFAPALAALVWYGGWALHITCGVLALLMTWEAANMALPDRRYEQVITYVTAAVIGLYTLGNLPYAWGDIIAPATVVFVMVAVLLRPEPIEATFRNTSLIYFSAAYGAGLIPYLARLRAIPNGGVGYALAALFCTWGADTGAYFAGRFFGRHKLYPKISPAKTVEGAIGGVAAAIGVAFIVRALFTMPTSPGETVAIGAVAGVAGIVGDLCESMLKRASGVKDSSQLIPGHGGVLDRFDAVMFAVPAVYVVVRLI